MSSDIQLQQTTKSAEFEIHRQVSFPLATSMARMRTIIDEFFNADADIEVDVDETDDAEDPDWDTAEGVDTVRFP